MLKKVIASLIAAVSLGSVCSLPINAYEETNYIETSFEAANSDIMPLYTNLGVVSAGMSITSDNKAYCYGSYFVYDDMKTNVTITLLKSTNGTNNWSAVTGESWTTSFTDYGGHSHGGTSTTTLSSNYYYCSMTEVTVYNSNGKAIETATCYSNVYHI